MELFGAFSGGYQGRPQIVHFAEIRRRGELHKKGARLLWIVKVHLKEKAKRFRAQCTDGEMIDLWAWDDGDEMPCKDSRGNLFEGFTTFWKSSRFSGYVNVGKDHIEAAKDKYEAARIREAADMRFLESKGILPYSMLLPVE